MRIEEEIILVILGRLIVIVVYLTIQAVSNRLNPGSELALLTRLGIGLCKSGRDLSAHLKPSTMDNPDFGEAVCGTDSSGLADPPGSRACTQASYSR